MKKIKDFARLCQTTEKTLRFYDRIGVLKAGYTDPKNGYRYYGADQAEQYLRIHDLKTVGFSLSLEAIPQGLEKPVLLLQAEAPKEELLSLYPVQFLDRDSQQIQSIRTVFIRIKGNAGCPDLEEIQQIMERIHHCFHTEASLIWGVDYPIQDSDIIELQILAF